MKDKHATVHDLKEKVRLFCEERNWDRHHNPKDLAIGVITEASELLEHFRFKTKSQVRALLKNPESRRAICDELIDVLHTVLRFAQLYGIDLSSELDRKMKKNGLKYPAPRKGKSRRRA
jgi:NTP pyrophosphatase (non-canonical NTP hydrolase)